MTPHQAFAMGQNGLNHLLIVAAPLLGEGTLGDPYFRLSGNQLAEQGYLCVTIDIPGHGEQHRADEPEGLAGWRYRLVQDVNLVAETNRRLSEVLDFLIATGCTDPARIAACGTSRGGFLAMQFTAAEPRIKCVAAFAPVTDLLALREFDGAGNNALVTSLSVINQAEKLAEKYLAKKRSAKLGKKIAFVAFVEKLFGF